MKRTVPFLSTHPDSVRFLTLVSAGGVLLWIIRKSGLLGTPFPGFTLVLISLLFLLGYPRGKGKTYLVVILVTVGITQWLLTQIAKDLASHPAWLLGVQCLLVVVWTFWTLGFHTWSKDLFTLWAVSVVVELAVVPPVSFAQELFGFGTLVLLTLWVLVERDRALDSPSS